MTEAFRPVLIHPHHLTIDANGRSQPSKRVQDWLSMFSVKHRLEWIGDEIYIYLDDEDDAFAAHLMFM